MPLLHSSGLCGNDFVAVKASGGPTGGYSLALKEDGSIVAWGYDFNWQVSEKPVGNDFRIP